MKKKTKSYLDIEADKIFKKELDDCKKYKSNKNKVLRPKKKKSNTPKPKSSIDKASGVFFDCAKDSEPSYAEKRIIKALNELSIKYYREVMFKKFVSGKGGKYRFDFYLPTISLVIEYDGETHNDPKVKKRDEEKNKFCKLKELSLLRFNKSHWKYLEQIVKTKVLEIVDLNSKLL